MYTLFDLAPSHQIDNNVADLNPPHNTGLLG